MIIRFNCWVIERRLTGGRAGIAGLPPGVGPFIGIGGSLFDDTGSIVRSSNGECQVSHRLRNFTATFPTVAHGSPLGDRTVSHGAPPDEEKWGGILRTSGKF